MVKQIQAYMNTFRKDIKDRLEFRRIGYQYVNVALDNEKHKGIWEMRKKGKPLSYEVIKGVKKKNPDGNYVWVYPSDEQFGTYGWYVNRPDAWKRAQEIYQGL